MSDYRDDDTAGQIDPSWSLVFIWPIAIIFVFVLTTLIIFIIHRRKKNHENIKNWNPSARTTPDDRELPSYADHWRSSRPQPWWGMEVVPPIEEDIEQDDPPPKYPECPKYPEAVFSGEGRQPEQEEGSGERQNDGVSTHNA
jgi:hypothetical protein